MPKDIPQTFRLVKDAIVRQDVEATLSCFTDEGSFSDPTGQWQGKESLRLYFTVGFRSTQDTVWELHRWLQEGSLFCVEWSYGFVLAVGPFQGKRVLFPGLSIIEFQDGNIYRWRDYWDSADFLRQVGAREWNEVIPPDVIVHFFQTPSQGEG